MSSLCLSCILYTIHDKPVKENKYITIFLIWLSNLIKNGGLKKDDILHMYIDKRTVQYLFNDSIFGRLIHKANFQTQIFGILPPKTHLEGMMWKYNSSEYTQDIYMYCDIDILIVNPLCGLYDTMKPNTIRICIEGLVSNPDYGADIPSGELAEGIHGFSAGKFIIRGKDSRDTLFKMINDFCNYEKNYYTIEQPFFNRAILNMTNIDVDVLVSPKVIVNSDVYDKHSTILFDCAGEPGNGECHYSKIIDAFCIINCDAF